MNNKELIEILDNIDKYISNLELNDNKNLYSNFQKLINILVLDNGCFDSDVVDCLDVLTDDLDSLNFGCVQEDISVLRDLL